VVRHGQETSADKNTVAYTFEEVIVKDEIISKYKVYAYIIKHNQ